MSKEKNNIEVPENEIPEESEIKTDEDVSETKAPEVVSKEEYDSVAEELKVHQDRQLRLAAEFDNYRKRTARERETLFRDAMASTVGEFLSVYDNLLRALENPTKDEAYKKGIEMIYCELCETLKKLNVKEIDPIDESFDPNLHNAVMHVEDDTVGENIVVQVLQKGFMLGDKVIRHAMVKVAN